ncbi:MAG: hypothetical protein NTX50_27980 [Candidatus Sumerlaeota bacterium]|nr:hypothetical protein [Candidatus Sumerlaeota bacterium]
MRVCQFHHPGLNDRSTIQRGCDSPLTLLSRGASAKVCLESGGQFKGILPKNPALICWWRV